MTSASDIHQAALAPNILLVATVAAYVIGAMIYTRVAHVDASRVRRLAFIVSLFTNLMVFFSAVAVIPWLVYLFAAYVAATCFGWARSGRDAINGGKTPRGAATMLLRKSARGGSA